MKFRDKRLDAEAVQFNSQADILTVINFVGEPVTITPDLTLTFADQAVAVGDWVVKSFDGKLSKVAQADFALGYVEVPADAVPQAGV